MLLCPLTGWRINVINIQIISGLTKHHSKQLWKTVPVVNVLTIHSLLALVITWNNCQVLIASKALFVAGRITYDQKTAISEQKATTIS